VNLTFFVAGTPGPQGSKRHVGNGRMVESSAKVVPWREAVRWTAYETARQQQWKQVEGAVSLSVYFNLAKPPSVAKRKLWIHKRPDIDKLLRSTLDALTSAGVWRDDAQVAVLAAHKRYADNGAVGGAVITIAPLEAQKGEL